MAKMLNRGLSTERLECIAMTDQEERKVDGRGHSQPEPAPNANVRPELRHYLQAELCRSGYKPARCICGVDGKKAALKREAPFPKAGLQPGKGLQEPFRVGRSRPSKRIPWWNDANVEKYHLFTFTNDSDKSFDAKTIDNRFIRAAVAGMGQAAHLTTDRSGEIVCAEGHTFPAPARRIQNPEVEKTIRQALQPNPADVLQHPTVPTYRPF
jgi:hypothetical protein